MFGSNAPTLGAVPAGCGAVVKAAEGVIVGAATLSGNPEEMRFASPEGATQPAEVAMAPLVSMVLLQSCMKPGTLPAMAVTWKVESVSNNNEYPARTTVLGFSDQATPRRGATAPILLFLNHRSAFPKVTVPCAPSGMTLGTSVCTASYGAGLYSQRTPKFKVRLGRSFHSSCT